MATIKRKFRFNQSILQYDFHLKKRFPWWWLLLLLLPLLLLIPIDKDFSVVTVDSKGNIVPNATVELYYVDHFIYRDGEFFGQKIYDLTEITDSEGYASYGKLRGSVFGLLFHNNAIIALVADNGIRHGEKHVRYYSMFDLPVPIVLGRADFVIRVKSLDTGSPLEGASLDLDFPGIGSRHYTTDPYGCVEFEVEDDMTTISHLLAQYPGYVDSEMSDIQLEDYLGVELVVWMYYKVDNVDIVLCIDGTGSMGSTLGAVKSSSKTIYTQLKDKCREHGKLIEKMRLRIVYFGDFEVDGKDALKTSRFFTMPGEEREYKTAVNNLELCGGGDTPESGLEALAVAMDSEWAVVPGRYRRLITLWSDAPAHPINTVGLSNPLYPRGIPKTDAELKSKWESISMDSSGERITRLLLVTPSETPWKSIKKNWNGVSLKEYDKGDAGNVDSMLDAIAKAM